MKQKKTVQVNFYIDVEYDTIESGRDATLIADKYPVVVTGEKNGWLESLFETKIGEFFKFALTNLSENQIEGLNNKLLQQEVLRLEQERKEINKKLAKLR